jgi:multidrug efflux system outer membrane protein
MSERAPLRLLLCGAALLSGCAVGPNYRRPDTRVPSSFRGQHDRGSASVADLPWWEVIHDAKLLTLLQEALAHSYDLQVAVARVEQARALAGVSTAALLPAVSAQAGASYQQAFSPLRLLSSSPGNLRYALYQLEGSLSWELDLWGRLRRLRESALADYLASEEARHGVLVSLIGDVAQDYFQLLTLDRQLAIAQRTLRSRRETLQLFQALESGGVGNRLQTASAEANLDSAAAEIPNLQRQIIIKENQLAILLGRAPGAIARSPELFDGPEPPALSAGLPAALLERRPDLRQAEARLIAANAQVGAVFAEYFPHLTLSAHGGAESTSLGTLLTSGAATFGIGLVANWLMPLLNGAQIRHRHRAQQANWCALVATYQQTLLAALAEVADALATLDQLREQRLQLTAEVRARSESVTLAKERFRNGVASYLEVVQAEQNLLPAEFSLAQTIGAQFVATTQLYRALGGGWQSEGTGRGTRRTSAAP